MRTLRAQGPALLSLNAVNEFIKMGRTLATRYRFCRCPLSHAFDTVTARFAPRGSETLAGADLLQKGAAATFVALGAILAGS